MVCSNCKAVIQDGARFCSNCGAPVTAGVQMTPPGGQPYTMQGQPLQGQGYNPMPQAAVVQEQTFVVRKMPIILIIVLTFGFIISSLFMENGSMDVAMAVSCLPGIILLFLIYKMDRIEPEPKGLMIKLFLAGGFIATTAAVIIETIVESVLGILIYDNGILYCFAQAFIVAAATEELCKYTLLKLFTWKHPAFNFRFDGVVYSTAVAIGFEVVENVLYLIDSTANTAFTRAAFPGHCIFGIYMGYYYGQAKARQLAGDNRGAKALRRKGVLTAILIHGTYDFICFFSEIFESELIQILLFFALTIVMVILNVTAYKNIKKYAFEDKPV